MEDFLYLPFFYLTRVSFHPLSPCLKEDRTPSDFLIMRRTTVQSLKTFFLQLGGICQYAKRHKSDGGAENGKSFRWV